MPISFTNNHFKGLSTLFTCINGHESITEIASTNMMEYPGDILDTRITIERTQYSKLY